MKKIISICIWLIIIFPTYVLSQTSGNTTTISFTKSATYLVYDTLDDAFQDYVECQKFGRTFFSIIPVVGNENGVVTKKEDVLHILPNLNYPKFPCVIEFYLTLQPSPYGNVGVFKVLYQEGKDPFLSREEALLFIKNFLYQL